MTKKNKKHLAIGGGLLLLFILVFTFAKRLGKDETEHKQIDVTVNITDENGQTVSYNTSQQRLNNNRFL